MRLQFLQLWDVARWDLVSYRIDNIITHKTLELVRATPNSSAFFGDSVRSVVRLSLCIVMSGQYLYLHLHRSNDGQYFRHMESTMGSHSVSAKV